MLDSIKQKLKQINLIEATQHKKAGVLILLLKENEDKLLINAGNIEIYAMSCGFPSLVILNGLLRNDWNRWEPKLFANEHPTYYGMLVSIY